MSVLASEHVFKRYEKKYMLSPVQAAALLPVLEEHMHIDQYGNVSIASLYMDTPQFRLIRTSIEKPKYKEKLRLRTYGKVCGESTAFVELKKKYKGVVYKRRVSMPYDDAYAWMTQGKTPPKTGQIVDEINWFGRYYGGVQPAAAIFYERVAYIGKTDDTLRVTLDKDIRYRMEELTLPAGTHGRALLPPGYLMMEVKIEGAMPLWLAHALDRIQIYPTSFSKYGRAYENTVQMRGEHNHDQFIFQRA